MNSGAWGCLSHRALCHPPLSPGSPVPPPCGRCRGREAAERRWDHCGLWGPPSAQIWLTLKPPARKCRLQAPPHSSWNPHLRVLDAPATCHSRRGPRVLTWPEEQPRGSWGHAGGGASLAATVCDHTHPGPEHRLRARGAPSRAEGRSGGSSGVSTWRRMGLWNPAAGQNHLEY